MAWKYATRRGLTLPISETTATRLDTWTRQFRPFSAAAGNPYLFPGKRLRPMTRAGLRDTLKAITDERLGFEINPHAFRHLAGYIFLKGRSAARPAACARCNGGLIIYRTAAS